MYKFIKVLAIYYVFNSKTLKVDMLQLTNPTSKVVLIHYRRVTSILANQSSYKFIGNKNSND